MKVTMKYEALVETLTSMAVVVEDSLNSEDMKSVIFMITKDKKVKLVGMNQMIVYRVHMPEDSYEVEAEDTDFSEKGVFYLQVKSKELTGFLSTFKSVRRTKVSDTILELEGNKIKLTVVEEGIDTGDFYRSAWRFDNIAIKQAVLKSIDVEMPKDAEQMETLPLQLYTSCLLPILQNTTSMNGMMQFGADIKDDEGNLITPSKVAAFTPTFNTLMNNHLPEQFRGISFYYRAVMFFKGVICMHDYVRVARTDQYMCFEDEGNFEAFVRYLTKVADYRPYIDMFDKSHAIMLDRQYLKDVLKRLSLVDEQITISIDEALEFISVSNSKFAQEIPILKEKNMEELDKVTFKIKPEVLERAIIGDDAQFSSCVFLYITAQERGGWTLVFSDDTGAWFSVARIR